MAWAGGVWDGTYGTSTSTVAGGASNIFYSKNFLMSLAETLRVAPLAHKENLPEGEGKTIQLFRYNQISKDTSAWHHLTEGTNPVPTLITGQDLQATVHEWGAFSQHSSIVKMAHIDRRLEGVTALWGYHAAELVDLLCQMEVCANSAYPVRCDGEISTGDYVYEGTVTTGTSTTVFADTSAASNTDFGDANDDCNQSVVVFLTGSAKGQARPVTDYATSGGVFTVSPAFDVKPAAGDTFIVVSAHGLTTSDILTTANVRNAITILRNNKAVPLEAGFYTGVLCPQTEKSLMADTNWVNVMQYRDLPEVKVNGLFAGEVGEWGGVRWVRTTQPFRFPITTVGTAGAAYGVGANVPGTSYTNYSASGAVYATPIFGKQAFGVTTFKSYAGQVMKPGIIIKNPGPQDTSNPLNRFSTVGWYLPFVAKGLNPLFAVQLWSGA